MPNEPGPRALLDPRWHWLQSALKRIYAELEPGSKAITLTLAVNYGNEMVSYVAASWMSGLERFVVTDGDQLVDALTRSTVNVTIDEEPWA